MSDNRIAIDDLFGYSVIVRTGFVSYESVPIYRGLAGYRAWVAAGKPEGLAAEVWAWARSREVSAL